MGALGVAEANKYLRQLAKLKLKLQKLQRQHKEQREYHINCQVLKD